MPKTTTDPLGIWLAGLQQRHLTELTLPEIRRALQALSCLYVEDRRRIARGGAFDSRGKRAAFALFYAPLHFLLVRCVVRALGAADPAPRQIFDLGCGTGAAGAAWSLETAGRSPVVGVDRHPWAIQETRWTYRTLRLKGRTRRSRLDQILFHGKGDAVIAAFAVNELEPALRSNLLGRLMASARRGSALLIVEPISRRAVPWWEEWSQALRPLQARADAWRFEQPLPEPLQRLDAAAGLDHSILTCRSLWVAPAGGGGVKPDRNGKPQIAQP